MQTIRAEIEVGGLTHAVTLVQAGLDDDRRPWRIEAPGEPFDGWLLGKHEIGNIERPA